MPYELPMRKIGSVATGLGNIQGRDELASLIGQTANDWNYLEKCMEQLYSGLMGRMYWAGREPNATYLVAPNAHPVAYQIFDELESFRAKQNVFEALLKWALINCDSEFLKYKEQTEKPLKNAYKARNRVVHALWGICADYPDALIEVTTFGQSLVWRKSDFLEELKKIGEGYAAFSKATAKFQQFVAGVIPTPC